MRKLLKFDFSAAVDGEIKDRVAEIGVAEDEPHGKIGMAGSSGVRLAQLGAMVIDQRLPRAVEQVSMAMRAELGLAWAKLCVTGGIGPLGP
ncbi:TMV resistance protein N-like [Pyrus ussuriensis x Pyrus communis]|uniref:TMV resistance protein N-like n=1 Tax=Pyrus ussuriensis x Pyrus communis TaxID=2448454 RepID=A0A5N5GJM7_9ROSA|nr:TMV resistance protein N-like [Pyrus ussuriensis x Pyrus communis]